MWPPPREEVLEMIIGSVRSRRQHLIVLAAMLSLLVGGIAKAEAETYTFTNIADSTGPFFSFGPAALNDRGVVAFSAVLDSGLDGIFAGDGAGTTTIADRSGPFRFFGPPSLNGSGVVAFKAFFSQAVGSAIVRSDGNATATIALSPSGFRFFGNPILNDSDTAAFFALDTTGSGIFTTDGIATTTIAHTPVPFTSFGDNPALAHGGAVAFIASNATGSGTFRSDGTTTTTMAHTSGPPFSSFGSPSLNNEGSVAFFATLDAGGRGIFRSTGSTTTLIADHSGTLNSFGSTPSINDHGMVAFWASLDAGGAGIFTGPDPSTDKVIALGDVLFGSTVVELTLGRQGLNNVGEIAFVARLADGTRGVYLAKPVPVEIPPEVLPGTPTEIHVFLDIKPGGNPNTIKLKDHGNVPFAILSTAAFDATTVDPATVTLAGAPVKQKKRGTYKAGYEDVNGDGRVDLMLHVSPGDLQLDESSTQAVLTGRTYDGTPITGTDSVRIKYKVRIPHQKDKDKGND
jgi:hypothetical protein